MATAQEHVTTKTNIIVLPYPVQGHINPMLQFSKRLAAKGLNIMFLNYIMFNDTTSFQAQAEAQINSIHIKNIRVWVKDVFDLQDVKLQLSNNFSSFIQEQNLSSNPPKLVIYDSVIPWVLDVVQNYGIDGVVFFTQNWAVNLIYYHINQGVLKLPLETTESICLSPFPLLRINDLPSFVVDNSTMYKDLLKLVLDQFLNFKQATGILCNTFDKLEDEVVKWMENNWSFKNIGPTIPSMYIDKRLNDDKDYGLSLFKPNIDDCMNWLGNKESNSVVYVSFGSLASLGKNQMSEIAYGLKMSGNYFLWVVRELEKKNIPENFEEKIKEKGLIVNWSPQLEVLSHNAVGCFLTHCGWNSTLEALSLGVPMVAMPQFSDQPMNAKYIEDVWKVGIRVKVGENGVVKSDEISSCIKEIIKGEIGKEVKKNSEKWKKMAREAIDEGGSSDRNIDDFIAKFK